MGFSVTMCGVRILVQKLYESGEITKSFYASEPLSIKRAITHCLVGFERIRNKMEQ